MRYTGNNLGECREYVRSHIGSSTYLEITCASQEDARDLYRTIKAAVPKTWTVAFTEGLKGWEVRLWDNTANY